MGYRYYQDTDIPIGPNGRQFLSDISALVRHVWPDGEEGHDLHKVNMTEWKGAHRWAPFYFYASSLDPHEVVSIAVSGESSDDITYYKLDGNVLTTTTAATWTSVESEAVDSFYYTEEEQDDDGNQVEVTKWPASLNVQATVLDKAWITSYAKACYLDHYLSFDASLHSKPAGIVPVPLGTYARRWRLAKSVGPVVEISHDGRGRVVELRDVRQFLEDHGMEMLLGVRQQTYPHDSVQYALAEALGYMGLHRIATAYASLEEAFQAIKGRLAGHGIKLQSDLPRQLLHNLALA